MKLLIGVAFEISFACEAEIDIRHYYFYLGSFSSILTIFLKPVKDLCWKCLNVA